MLVGKDKIEKLFSKENFFQLKKSCLHFPNNKRIDLTQEIVDEIKNHAIALLVTGVDLSTDIWAIQWPNDYIVKSI